MDAYEKYHIIRQKHLEPCPECGSDNTDFNVPEKGALGIYCNDCEWSIGPYET